jgi:hypothetical protein
LAAWTVFGGSAITSLHILLSRREYVVDALYDQVTAVLLNGLLK